MMKKIYLSIFIVLLMNISFVVAFPVDISYSAPQPVVTGKPAVVGDVPFTLTVTMNTNDEPVLSYNLFITSDDGLLRFIDARRGILFPSNLLSPNTGPQGGGATYRYQVQPAVGYAADTMTAQSIFTLTTSLPGITASQAQLKRDGAIIHADNVITPSAARATVEISDAPLGITPGVSTCADGIVGYIESGTPDGIKQATEPNEACDDGNVLAGDGCAAQCDYVELGWQCGKTNFGDRESDCSELPAGEFFIQKMSALIQGQCYPQTTPACTHPQALYKSGNSPQLTYDASGKLDASEKIYLITQISAALREFFTETIES